MSTIPLPTVKHLIFAIFTFSTPLCCLAEQTISINFDKNDPSQKGALAAKMLQFCELYNSFTLCQFSPIPATMIAQILADITGEDFKTMDLLTFGERSLNLKRAINNKLGATSKDDKVPGGMYG